MLASLYACSMQHALAKRGRAPCKKTFTQSCKLSTWTTCKLVARNYAAREAWEAWEAWKYSCMEVAGKKHVKKHFFPVTEKVIT